MVAIPIVDSVLNLFRTTVEKVVPDANTRETVKLALANIDKAQFDAELSLITNQLEVNKIEAASGSLFRGGWRPAAGWTCVLGLVYVSIIAPIIGIWVQVPAIDTSITMQILFGMLGMGGLRSFEKVKGKD